MIPRRRFLLGLALLPAHAGLARAAGEARTAAAPRIVFQVNDEDSRKWHVVLANINNVQEELGKVEVAVVVIGPALGMLKADALTANKVQDAMSALVTAHDRVLKAREALTLNERMEAAERRKFELGDSTILIVNLRELSSIEAELTLIDALTDFFKAQADYRAATADNPAP